MNPRKLKVFLFISSLIIFIALSQYLGWFKPIEIFLRDLMLPVTRTIYNVNVKMDEKSSFEDLKQKYDELSQNYINSKVDQVELELLREENEILRDSLNFIKEKNFDFVSADVVGKNLDPVGSSIIINIGEEAEISVGDPVIIGNGILIGRISQVYQKSSVVKLLNDNQSKFASTILNEEGSTGIVEGGFGLSIRMNFIPQHETLTIGDIVITSGLEKQVPRGLVIGNIEAFEKKPYEPFQSAIVGPLKDYDSVTTVTVLKSESNL